MLQEYEKFPNWLIDVEEGKIWSKKHKRFIGSENKDGYLICSTGMLHRVIWMTANGCDIPEGYEIHHIDGDRQNNSIYNLELIESFKHKSEHKKGVTFSEEHKRKLSEIRKGTINPKDGDSKLSYYQTHKIKIAQYTLTDELIKTYDSFREIERNGFDRRHVKKICENKYRHKTHKGYKWKYKDETEL